MNMNKIAYQILKYFKENSYRFFKNPKRFDYEPYFQSAFERYKLLKIFEKAKEIFEKKLSVRDVEKSTSKHKNTRKKQIEKDPNIVDLEKELSDKIGLKTEIEFHHNGSSGSLKLYYSDLNQLDEIMKRLKK